MTTHLEPSVFVEMFFRCTAQSKLTARDYFMTDWDTSRENVVLEKYTL